MTDVSLMFDNDIREARIAMLSMMHYLGWPSVVLPMKKMLDESLEQTKDRASKMADYFGLTFDKLDEKSFTINGMIFVKCILSNRWTPELVGKPADIPMESGTWDLKVTVESMS